MRPGDAWGPFARNIEASERVARLRALRVIVHLLLGPRGRALAASIRAAERGQTMGLLRAVLADLDALAATDRRRVLASYGAVSRDG